MDDFHSPMAFDELAESARGSSRDSLFLQAIIHVADSVDDFTVRVRNLSSTGMLVESPRGLKIDTVLVSEIKNIGRVPGRVAWSGEGKFGVAFDHPVDPHAARRKPPEREEVSVIVAGLGLSRPANRKPLRPV